MAGQAAKNSQEKRREELLQNLVDQMFFVMKQMHHGVPVQSSSLGLPQARLLFIIAGNQDSGTSVKDLAKKTDVTSGAITQFVDTLVKKGLIRRYEDPADRRIVRLTLTEAAKNQLDELHHDFLSSSTRVFAAVTNDEIEQLIKLLSKVSSSASSRLPSHKQ
jgi:DNA-binding MarR family transcriptional regulator